jgi:hypothetical protein
VATVAAGNGTVTTIAELTAPGTIGGSGAVTFPGGVVLVGSITGATTGAFSGTITHSGAAPQITISATTGTQINSAQAAAGSFTINTTTTSSNASTMFQVTNNTSQAFAVGSGGAGAFAGNVSAVSFNSIPQSVQGSPSTSPGFYTGVGVPTISAANGSVYLRFDGATGGSMWYANTSGASTVGTTWTAQAAP